MASVFRAMTGLSPTKNKTKSEQQQQQQQGGGGMESPQDQQQQSPHTGPGGDASLNKSSRSFKSPTKDSTSMRTTGSQSMRTNRSAIPPPPQQAGGGDHHDNSEIIGEKKPKELKSPFGLPSDRSQNRLDGRLPPPAYYNVGATNFQGPYNTSSVDEFLAPDWQRKESRQRRFTEGTLPVLHARKEAIREVRDFDDEDRDQALDEMNSKLDDMTVSIKEYAEYKDEEFKQYSTMYDEEGNLLPGLTDEDGYPLRSDRDLDEGPKKKNLTVTFNLSQIKMLEGGFLWKKGGGAGVTSRKNWTKRYFKINRARPLDLMYFRAKPEDIEPKRAEETDDQFKGRQRAFYRQEKVNAAGIIDLADATLKIPDGAVHKDKRVKSEYEFAIETKVRTFRIFAEDEESFNNWMQTISYILGVLEQARTGSSKRQKDKSRRERNLIDEAKRDAAQACSAFGPGLFEAVAGQPAEFTIQASNEAGVPDEVGGRQFSVVLESVDLHYDLAVTDNADGTYTVRYIPTRVGVYELSVLLDDYDVYGSPFSPAVKPAPVSAPHCVAEGAGLFCAVVGVVNQFTIQTRNLFSQVVQATGVEFEIELGNFLELLDDEDGGITDNDDGTYTISYVVNEDAALMERLENGDAIETDIIVKLNDGIHTPSFPRNIKNSPFHPVLAASATGGAMAAAARRAASRLYPRSGSFFGEQQHSQMIRSPSVPKMIHKKLGSVNEEVENISSNKLESPPKRAPPKEPQESNNKYTSHQNPPPIRSGVGSMSLDSSSLSRVDNSDMSHLQSSYLPIHTADQQPFANISSPIPSFGVPVSRESIPRSQQQQQQYQAPQPQQTNHQNLNNSSASARDRYVSQLQQNNTSNRYGEIDREQMQQLRHELDESRNLVDQQVGRMAVMGRRVQADSEWLMSQARDLADRSPDARRHKSPSFINESGGSGKSLRVGGAINNNNNSSSSSVPRAAPVDIGSFSNSSPRATTTETQKSNRSAGTTGTVLPLTSTYFDANVMAMFEKFQPVLLQVYDHYASMGTIRMPGFVRLAQDYDITPTFISRKELRECFDLASQSSDALSFQQFVESLGHIAVCSLSKPMFSHLYTTTLSRVNVILVMWGVGDITKLNSLRRSAFR